MAHGKILLTEYLVYNCHVVFDDWSGVSNFYLARPGDEDAERAIHRSRPFDPIMALLPLMSTFYILAFLLLPEQVATIFFLATSLPLTGMATYRFLKPRKSPLQRALESGNVIAVDYYLIEAWDLLRERLGIRLTQNERSNALRDLFDVAIELRSKLARYRELENEPELQDERDEVEAYIRARLLLEVKVLGASLTEARKLGATSSLEVQTVNPEEVAEELSILEAERGKRQELPPAQD